MSLLVSLVRGQSSVKTELVLRVHKNDSAYPIQSCLV